MSKAAHPAEVLYRSFDGTTVTLPEYYPTLPYGVGEPDPTTYPQRPDWKFVNGHTSAHDIALYEEAHAAIGARLSEDAMNMAAYDVDSEISLATIEQYVRLSDILAAGPCAPGCQDHDVWTQHIVNGHVVDVPVPDIVANEAPVGTDRWDLVPDTLATYTTSDAAVSIALNDVGFQYKDQVWVDGLPYGVIELDEDARDVILPTFRYQYRGSDVRAVCVCGTSIVYSEVCATRGVLVEDPRMNMRAFVAMLLLHANALHAEVTKEDVCKHGLRRFVQSKSRSTGQPFKAKFCTDPRKPCDPVWVND